MYEWTETLILIQKSGSGSPFFFLIPILAKALKLCYDIMRYAVCV